MRRYMPKRIDLHRHGVSWVRELSRALLGLSGLIILGSVRLHMERPVPALRLLVKPLLQSSGDERWGFPIAASPTLHPTVRPHHQAPSNPQERSEETQGTRSNDACCWVGRFLVPLEAMRITLRLNNRNHSLLSDTSSLLD